MSYLVESVSTAYPSDVSDAEWALLAPLMPRNEPNGRDMTTSMRDVVNAIFYQNRSGCQWRMLPGDFPPWSTVAGYYYRWMKDGTLSEMLDLLREKERVAQGKNPQPTAGIVDSQAVKVPPQAGEHGYTGHKKINGRKRHLLVDTLGLMLAITVTAANVDDRVGAALLANDSKKSSPVCIKSGRTVATSEKSGNSGLNGFATGRSPLSNELTALRTLKSCRDAGSSKELLHGLTVTAGSAKTTKC